MEIRRSEEEINRVLTWAADGKYDGTHYAGMSYEEGILNALDWLFGNTDDPPDEELEG